MFLRETSDTPLYPLEIVPHSVVVSHKTFIFVSREKLVIRGLLVH